MCNAFMEDTCACAKLLRYISPGPSSVLIFSKQCTGKQEQDLFSLSLNEILVHTWVLNARESIFSILLYVCSQNLSVENSYTNT